MCGKRFLLLACHPNRFFHLARHLKCYAKIISAVCFCASTAYWYAEAPAAAIAPPPVAQRMPILRENTGRWLADPKSKCPGPQVALNAEMKKMKREWARLHRAKPTRRQR